MIALALALAIGATPCDAEIGARFGVAASRSSTGGNAADLAFAAYGAVPLEPCLDWPLRAELQLSSTSIGAPWGAGVDAVEVSAWHSDLAVLAGLAPVLKRAGRTDLGVELLAGPSLRLSRVSTRVYDQEESTWDTRLLGRLGGGGFAQLGALRVEVRLGWSVPRGDGVTMLAGLGYRW